MAGFKATTVVSKMSYDFTGIPLADQDVAKVLDAAKGVTPEPSGEQVRQFQIAMRSVLGLPQETPQAEILATINAKSKDELLDLDEDFMDIVSEVTSGMPSREILAALPFRIREAYYGYIYGEMTNFLAGSATTPR